MWNKRTRSFFGCPQALGEWSSPGCRLIVKTNLKFFFKLSGLAWPFKKYTHTCPNPAFFFCIKNCWSCFSFRSGPTYTSFWEDLGKFSPPSVYHDAPSSTTDKCSLSPSACSFPPRSFTEVQIPRECPAMSWWAMIPFWGLGLRTRKNETLSWKDTCGKGRHQTRKWGWVHPVGILPDAYGRSRTAEAQAPGTLRIGPIYLTLCDPTDLAHQAPLSMGFSRQEHGNGLPFPSPRRPIKVFFTFSLQYPQIYYKGYESCVTTAVFSSFTILLEGILWPSSC